MPRQEIIKLNLTCLLPDKREQPFRGPMKVKAFIFLFVLSCAQVKAPENPAAKKSFSKGEVIIATELLVKIFDQEMAPLKCVPDTEEAALLLRTIRPRMETVEDDLEASLDHPGQVADLIASCDQNCTCQYLDDLFREHQVILSEKDKKALGSKNTEKELNRCMSFAQSTFCQSDLYRELTQEKADFSFEE